MRPGAAAGAASVRVRAPARLHLGIFPLPGGGFGGLGVALRRPVAEVVARPARDLTASGPQAERALGAARAVAERCAPGAGAALAVVRDIPSHVGLGSGTQIDLAAAVAVARLWGVGAGPRELAPLVGRAQRTRVGTETFAGGGLVLYRAGAEPPAVRLDVPARWRFVVAIPGGASGFAGPDEARAFADLPPMERADVEAITAAIDRLLLPSLRAGDVAGVGAALEVIQARVGDYFAPVQGGRYRHPLGERLARAMRAAGAWAAGQSSWGPALFGLAESPGAARRIAAAARRVLEAWPQGGWAFVTAVSPGGAAVVVERWPQATDVVYSR
ncbi:GHMP family kinase ATP-binding protein [Caldinitratiruptor microaerophilus]|uniref:Beta-ribofuranosylaminobenzene 5'-phosphate synthase n=1 Tax=Caldinitratiruptor microaerophilus TaxID=671077 RepID=A0AA35CL05_9FIRM|nr:hypothetical protein [Caldinitratiruptor microaerophilus]BDG60459.1 beta-ribofuranosylaminobenzene 5'-phosphate synthase [Caldinitratiruptor microaerophilus]